MSRKKILIAEDEEQMRTLLVRALKKHGYEIITVKNGLEAGKQIEKTHFDLIITDFRMPFFDGLQLMDLVKKKYPSLPVIIISGTEPVDRLLTGGAFAFVKKPFQIQELVNMVKCALDQTMDQTQPTAFNKETHHADHG